MRADGLAALKRFVFEGGGLTWEELIAALDDNFEGHERLR